LHAGTAGETKENLMKIRTRTATAAVAATALLGGGILLAAGPASADVSSSTGLKSATICVTAPDDSNVLAHTKVVAVSWEGQNYRETSVKKVDSSGCATVYFGQTGRVYFRAVGVTHDSSTRTTKTYRAHWGTYNAANLPDPEQLSGALKVTKTVTRTAR
jgi:hypothetical protein